MVAGCVGGLRNLGLILKDFLSKLIFKLLKLRFESKYQRISSQFSRVTKSIRLSNIQSTHCTSTVLIKQIKARKLLLLFKYQVTLKNKFFQIWKVRGCSQMTSIKNIEKFSGPSVLWTFIFVREPYSSSTPSFLNIPLKEFLRTECDGILINIAFYKIMSQSFSFLSFILISFSFDLNAQSNCYCHN